MQHKLFKALYKEKYCVAICQVILLQNKLPENFRSVTQQEIKCFTIFVAHKVTSNIVFATILATLDQSSQVFN